MWAHPIELLKLLNEDKAQGDSKNLTVIKTVNSCSFCQKSLFSLRLRQPQKTRLLIYGLTHAA